MGSISVALNNAGARVHSWSSVYSAMRGRLTPDEKSIDTMHAATAMRTSTVTVNPTGTTKSSTVSLSTSVRFRTRPARGMRTVFRCLI